MYIKINEKSIKIIIKNIFGDDTLSIWRPNQIKTKGNSTSIINLEISNIAGIYFLFNKNKKLLYVGQGIDIRKRVAVHTSNYATNTTNMDPREIDSITYLIENNPIKRNILEAIYIHVYNPPHNCTKFNSIVKKRTECDGGMTFEDARKYAKEAREKIEKKVEDKSEAKLVYCKSCGKEIAADSKFCRYCGVEQ